MILVVGGIGAGKRTFVRGLGYDSSDIGKDPADAKPVIYDVQELVRNTDRISLLEQLLIKEVVICNEVGAGVVPLDEADRKWREEVGRLGCELAHEAQAVVRVCCGVGQVIKGSL